jgi:hypothetical protein
MVASCKVKLLQGGIVKMAGACIGGMESDMTWRH